MDAIVQGAELKMFAGDRRWQQSRPQKDWTDRDAHFHNTEAIRASRSCDSLLAIRRRLTKTAETDALWDGYWYVKEWRDKCRERVAKQVAPWFEGGVSEDALRDEFRAKGWEP